MRNQTAPPFPFRFRAALCVTGLVVLGAVAGGQRALAEPSSLRRTAIVRAIEKARPAVVNIHGRKILSGSRDEVGDGDEPRRFNGMGTGVVVDQRGYILTNDHVVDSMSRIDVTLEDGRTFVARLVDHSHRTDLAVVKIDVPESLPVITIGTSDDLMVGEPVVAVGNAYGYEDTVTRGVVSALHRTVQINDTQTYEDLIQTDASINPGNSGGPLLNIEGEMIGINVAVRSGAQGIGFAIPVDSAMEVTAKLLSIRHLNDHWHGVVAKKITRGRPRLVVERVEQNSPAAAVGLRPGDVITAVGSRRIDRALDFERALLGRPAGKPVEVTLERNDRPLKVEIVLAGAPPRSVPVDERIWNVIGLRLVPMPADQFRRRHPRYRGGLTVTAVRPGSPADAQGVRPGDILVGMHIWETITIENVAYVLKRVDAKGLRPLKFYVLRGNQPFFGYLTVAGQERR